MSTFFDAGALTMSIDSINAPHSPPTSVNKESINFYRSNAPRIPPAMNKSVGPAPPAQALGDVPHALTNVLLYL
jgi:hypothetical protein